MVSMAGESIEVKDAKGWGYNHLMYLMGHQSFITKSWPFWLISPMSYSYSPPLHIWVKNTYGEFPRGISTIPYHAILAATPTEVPNLHPIHTHVASPKDKVEPIGSHSIPKHLPKVVSQHVLIEKSKLLRVQYANPQVLKRMAAEVGEV